MVKRGRKRPGSTTVAEDTFTPRQWLAVVFGPLLLAILFMTWILWSSSKDLADSPERHGIGVVSEVQTQPTGKGQFELLVWIDMNGSSNLFRPYAWDDNTLSDIKPGRQVNVDYKIGKSRTIYIDQIVPTGHAKKDKTLMGRL